MRVSIHRARPLPFLGLRLLPHRRRRLLYPIWYFDAIENLEGPLRGCLPGRGGGPPGGAYPAGARSISFSAEKETGLDSKEKGGPVYGGFLVVHGGLRLYALFEDHSRPLRPSRPGTETTCGSILGPPARASLRAECGSALRGARQLGTPSPCVGVASGRPPPVVAALRRAS